MKTIILTEEQMRNVIGNVISEQSASEFYGGTDAQKISHALLSKNWGLPDGANNESSYYGANVADVIKMSSTGDRSKFLSIFKPANKYSEDPKFYYDSIFVNNEKLENSGTKAFRFVNGNVYATHNGLLALARAMVYMGGNGGVLTISFGKSTTGKEAVAEKKGGSVNYDSNRALNQVPSINSIESNLVYLSTNPKFKDKGLFIGVHKELSQDDTVAFIKRMLNYMAMGAYGFMDWSKKDEIIQTLTPKGFISNFDEYFDITPFAQKLISLQNMMDFLPDNNGQYTEYNEDKQNQLNSIGASFEAAMFNQAKAIYMKNFQIYVENYLPNSATQIFPLIKNVKFTHRGLGKTHYEEFHSYRGGSSQSSTTLSQQSGNFKTGN